MSTLQERIEIINRLGIHARAAAMLVQLAREFTSSIVLSKDGTQARATSVLELLMLCGQCGTAVDVRVEGDDAELALAAVRSLFIGRFGEPN